MQNLGLYSEKLPSTLGIASKLELVASLFASNKFLYKKTGNAFKVAFKVGNLHKSKNSHGAITSGSLTMVIGRFPVDYEP